MIITSKYNLSRWKYNKKESKFSDVPAWAQESVQYLVDKEAVHGKPDGTFVLG